MAQKEGTVYKAKSDEAEEHFNDVRTE